jgi:multidrug resistance protein MdtO
MEKSSAATPHSPLPPFVVPSRANSPSAWAERIWEDLQPTPGRLGATLRLVLATVMTLLAVLILQVPYAAVALYFVFFVGRESPAVSLRSLFMLVPILAAVATELGIVILTDNDPMARVLAVAGVSFFAGILTVATTQPAVGSTFAFLFVTLIAFWETNAPASHLVTISLWVVSALSTPILSSIAVEYVFGARHPAAQLCEQNAIRWRAFTEMFTVFGEKASPERRAEAIARVSRLAATGQEAMQGLYNKIVERNLDTGALMIGARVRITMLAQLMDLAAAVGSAPYADDPDNLLRYKRIASEAQNAFECSAELQPPHHEFRMGPHPTLLDRVEAMLHSIRSMPTSSQISGPTDAEPEDKKLVAIPAKKLHLLIPGGFTSPANVAFGLKLSLCATICYILYHVVDYPGISTCVITVFITGLTTTGAIKQKFAFRLLGSMLGGLLGLGAAAFLFPNMDSITSLAILVSILAFIAGWAAQGRRFSYVGMQIAFSFYLVAFEGFSAPTRLAPPRDRLIGILLALVVMWIVFDQIWPIRTLSVMRRTFAALLHDGASLFRLPGTMGENVSEETEALRDRMGRTVAALRVMNEAIEYEFGVDREPHIRSSQAILRAALTAVAIFWNQVVLLHHGVDRDLLNDSQVAGLRHELAATMDAMADSVAQAKAVAVHDDSQQAGSTRFENPRYRDYATHALTRLRELRDSVLSIDPA